MSVSKYKVTFHHMTVEKYLQGISVPHMEQTTSHVTLAKLWDYSTFPRKLLCVAMAKCSRKDNFSRPVGRKISFQRLMDSCNLTKPEKRILWGIYFPIKQSEVEKLKAEIIKLKHRVAELKPHAPVGNEFNWSTGEWGNDITDEDINQVWDGLVENSLARGWKEAMEGDTIPLSDLWDGVDTDYGDLGIVLGG